MSVGTLEQGNGLLVVLCPTGLLVELPCLVTGPTLLRAVLCTRVHSGRDPSAIRHFGPLTRLSSDSGAECSIGRDRAPGQADETGKSSTAALPEIAEICSKMCFHSWVHVLF